MNLLSAEFEFEWAAIKRYPLNYLSNIMLLLIMFFGIFMGGRLVGVNPIGNTFTSLVLGYSLWILIVQTVENMGTQITNEAQTGTLEQLYLMPVSPTKTFLVKSVVNLIFSVIYSFIILLILMLSTGKWLHSSLIVIVPYILALIAVMGLGYLIAGLSLRYKKIGATLQIGQYIYLGLILTDFKDASPVLRFFGYLLPIEPMVYWIQDTVNKVSTNLEAELLVCGLNAVIWLILGMMYFNHVNKIVKQQGSIAFF